MKKNTQLFVYRAPFFLSCTWLLKCQKRPCLGDQGIGVPRSLHVALSLSILVKDDIFKACFHVVYNLTRLLNQTVVRK
jgi:hypothetical protein